MVLAMMFLRSFIEMVKVDPKDLDYVEMRAIGWILSALTKVVAEMETVYLLH